MQVRSAPIRFSVPSVREVGPEEQAIERRVLAHMDAHPARQLRVRRRHAPMEAAARRLNGARERRTDHHGVRARHERLAEVATGPDPAVGDDRDVAFRCGERTRRAA